MKAINWRAATTSLALCFIPAIIGGLATSASVTTWYPTLINPPLNPPNWIFGPVWTLLYTLQGISLYLLRTTKSSPDIKTIAIVFFYLQLALNLVWSLLFFGLRSPYLAAVEIGLLVLTVAFTILSTYRVSKVAAYLLLPYFAWISFASYLNIAILELNR